jgi:hypothetical protein
MGKQVVSENGGHLRLLDVREGCGLRKRVPVGEEGNTKMSWMRDEFIPHDRDRVARLESIDDRGTLLAGDATRRLLQRGNAGMTRLG